MYAIGYYQDVAKRGPGAAVFHVGELILLIGAVAFGLQVFRS
jgi:hypothetical protein